MISTIIFDWGNVLTTEKYSTNLMKNIENEFNSKLDLIIFKRYLKQLNEGKINTESFVIDINNSFNIKLTKEKLIKLLDKTININHKTIKLVKILKPNYTLILLSNNNEPTVELIRTKYKDILNLFNKAYFSHELKLIKPGKEIFEYVIKDLNLNPKSTVFIDDDEENTKTAENLGIKSINYSSTEKLIEELNKLKINTH
jgi:putative hydrolase of the HAD superfamily